MYKGQIIPISVQNATLSPDEYNPSWQPHRTQGIKAEKQLFEVFGNWVGNTLQSGEVLEKSKHRFTKYDFKITHLDGSVSYFDAKTRSLNSKTYTLSLEEWHQWQQFSWNGDNVYVLCGTNVSETSVRIDGLWPMESIDVYPSKYDVKSCYFNKPAHGNMLN